MNVNDVIDKQKIDIILRKLLLEFEGMCADSRVRNILRVRAEELLNKHVFVKENVSVQVVTGPYGDITLELTPPYHQMNHDKWVDTVERKEYERLKKKFEGK